MANTNTQQPPPAPNPALMRLDRLVGTWNIKGRESGPDGEIHGQITFEWMEGGFFLVQHVAIDYIGHKIKGIEYIGYDASKQALNLHYFENTGNVFEYVWEGGDDTLTIWGGYKGSPASFKGKFSDDGNTITGRWEWPADGKMNSDTGEWEWTDDGKKGGYESTMTRVK